MTRGGRPRQEGDDAGSMSIEMLFLVPILLAFTMLVVAAGRYADLHGRVDAVSRDAARAASMARSYPDAVAAAQQTADQSVQSLKGAKCSPVDLKGDFVAGGTITVTVSCTISLQSLALRGLPGSVTIRGESSAPLDIYRRA